MNRLHFCLTAVLSSMLLFSFSCIPDIKEQLAKVPDLPALQVGGFGQDPGQFQQVGPSAIDNMGNIVVADNVLRRITWFDLDGKPSRLVYFSSENGSPALPEVDPPFIQALAFRNTRLYVVSRNNVWIVQDETSTRLELQNLPGTVRDLVLSDDADRLYALTDDGISIHDNQGMQLDLWRLEGERSPSSRAMTLGPNGMVYVSARRWRQVIALNLDGQILHRLGATETDLGEFSGVVRGLAVDGAGNVFIYDEGEGAVKIFDALHQFRRQIGRKGSGPGETLGCERIMIDRERQRLILVDVKNYRIQVYDLTGREARTRDLVKHNPLHPPTVRPDHVILTLSAEPLTERRINWRTDSTATGSHVELLRIAQGAAVEALEWDSPAVVRFKGEAGASFIPTWATTSTMRLLCLT